MKLIKCKNNHFYSDKFMSCPHCANELAGVSVDDIFGKNQQKIDTAILHPGNLRHNPRKTVGWLVCIDGEMTGESFVLREGENLIGRAAHMDVSLLYESTISRERHAIISYDEEKSRCVLRSAGPDKAIFCNDKPVKLKHTLKDRDVITLGDCTLIFVAFCNNSFHWHLKGFV